MQHTVKQDKLKIYTIRDRLALELVKLMDEMLSAAVLDENTLAVRVLAILGREPYASQLLFQDFSQPRQAVVATQSLVYLNEILLLYRLRPAAAAQGEPGNMHRLLEALFRKAKGPWTESVIRRGDYPPPCPAVFCITVVEKLAVLCWRLEPRLSEIAKRQREKYGYLQLHAESCRAEVPEELSWFEVLWVLPLPLQDVAADQTVPKLMLKVMESLNERYMLLRACGLDPENWLHHTELSIGNLQDMRQLRKTAVERATGEGCEHDLGLYARCFQALQGDRKKFAGFVSFDAFSHSEAGSAFLQAFAFVELPPPTEWADEADEDDHESERRVWVESLMEAYPKPFRKDPLMGYFFRESLAGGRPLCSDGEGILDDPALRELAQNDAQYADLDDQALARKIYQNAKRIINAGRNQCTPKIYAAK